MLNIDSSSLLISSIQILTVEISNNPDFYAENAESLNELLETILAAKNRQRVDGRGNVEKLVEVWHPQEPVR